MKTELYKKWKKYLANNFEIITYKIYIGVSINRYLLYGRNILSKNFMINKNIPKSTPYDWVNYSSTPSSYKRQFTEDCHNGAQLEMLEEELTFHAKKLYYYIGGDYENYIVGKLNHEGEVQVRNIKRGNTRKELYQILKYIFHDWCDENNIFKDKKG